jgi:hypothetical protein
MNLSLAKYTVLLCLAVIFSTQVLSLGVIAREELVYAVLIFLAFGMIAMRLDGVINRLRLRKAVA